MENVCKGKTTTPNNAIHHERRSIKSRRKLCHIDFTIPVDELIVATHCNFEISLTFFTLIPSRTTHNNQSLEPIPRHLCEFDTPVSFTGMWFQASSLITPYG